MLDDIEWAGLDKAWFIEQEKIKARDKLMDNLEMLAFADFATPDDIEYAMSDIRAV